MPTTKTYETFKFSELSDKAKEKAIAYFQEHNDFSHYAECVVDNFKDLLDLIGFSNVKIYYSGFWSQGDGACFEFDYKYAKGAAKAISKETGPSETELIRIAKALQELQRKNFYGLKARGNHRGNYYHENSIVIDFLEGCAETKDYETDLEEFSTLARDLMRRLYSELEKEYDYQNSEAQIIEMLEANDCDFLECGKLD
jgi:hypothetical protein